jgi:hypothetical protein
MNGILENLIQPRKSLAPKPPKAGTFVANCAGLNQEQDQEQEQEGEQPIGNCTCGSFRQPRNDLMR